MSTLPHTSSGTGAGSYTAEFTGYILAFLYAGGGGGSGGVGLSRGGSGGGGGALSVSVIPVTTGGVYNYFVGSGGAGGTYPDGAGSNGTDTYWEDGLHYRAAGGHGAGSGVGAGGAGGSNSDSLGDTIQPGENGTGAVSSDYSGQPGGKAGGTAGGAGGVATGGGGQGAGGAGSAPGGGGSGGGQSNTGVGGAGAAGQVYIVAAPDTRVGYHALGIDSSGVYLGAGQYDYTAEADGIAAVELWGSGAGGASGATSSLQGRAGGGGGAYVRKLVTVHKGVVYRRVVPAGGAGGAWSFGNFPNAGANGADATFTLAPINVATKKITGGNLATLTFATPHGYNVGDSIIVAGVDATFNGTFTITAIASDRKSLSYAKTATNTGPSTATGTVSPNFNIALAKGGVGAAANATGAGSGGAGGSTAASIGDVKYKGEDGEDCWGAVTGGVTGTNGGAGGYPNGGLGGWGGKRNEDDNTPVIGSPGIAPGGGGGGGAGQNNATGGAGAAGGAVIRYILSLGTIVESHTARSILRIRWKSPTDHLWKEITDTNLVRSHAKVNQKKIYTDPDAGKRSKPSYIPAGYESRFDLETGRFNWEFVTHVGPALAADNFTWAHVGDSVSDGSNALNRTNPLDYTIDYTTAYPRKVRASLAATYSTIQGGTGLVRPCNVATPDPQWVRGSWSDKTHYLESSTATHVATFTPVVAGTAVRVVTISKGSVDVTIDDVLVGTIAGGATDAAVQGQTYVLGGAPAFHVVKVSPSAGTTSGAPARVLGADCYVPNTGIKVHNLSQGGSRAALGSASSPQQNVWGDTGAAAPTNMTNIYKNVACYDRRPDAVVGALGGNDAFQLISAANIKTAMDTVFSAFDHADTDIIIYSDVHNTLQMNAMMQLCIERNWGMIDFFWLSRNLRSIFGLDYNGDTYGHLNNTTGVTWMSGLLAAGLGT